MDIVVAMLAENAIKQLENKGWNKFPYNIEKNMEFSEQTHDITLYKYFIKNAVQYPKTWVDNNYNADVIAHIEIKNKTILLNAITIIHKANALQENDIYNEVEKTIKRANINLMAFISTRSDSMDNICTTFSIPISWKAI